jgi:two-component system, LytTR family, response regulator
MRALIVDDEPLARRELRRLLAEHPEVEIVGEAGDVASAAAAIGMLRPDLVLLDIHMPGRTGFELLASLDDAPQVVFTTAHDAHALQAFEVGAVDYLLKPISPARLAAALARVAERKAASTRAWLPDDRPLLVREGEKSWLVRLRDVEVFEACGNYVQVHFGAQRPLLLRSLQQLEERLDPAVFFRASRTHLLNLAHVDRLDTGERGELVALLKSGRTVAFSRRQSLAFRRERSL